MFANGPFLIRNYSYFSVIIPLNVSYLTNGCPKKHQLKKTGKPEPYREYSLDR